MEMCDYCEKPSVCKITVHNHYWNLCFDCAKVNQDRLGIKQEDLDRLEREIHQDKEIGDGDGR